MGTRTRYSLILLLLFTLTGWAQNIRVTSLTATTAITNNGQFVTPAGAGNLKIWTSDANGVGSWQAPGSAVDTNALARLNGLGTNAQINGFTVTAGGFTNLATHNTNAGPVYNGSYVTTYGVNTNKGNSFFEGNMRFANGDYEYDSVGRTHGFNGSILSDDIITIVSGGLSIAGGPLVVNDPSTMNDLTIGVTGTLTASGPTRLLGSLALAPSTNTSLAINQAGAAHQRYTTNANFTVTFTGTALDGARGQFDVVNTAATNITVTWPVSYSVASGATFTSFTAKSNAITEVFWHKVSGSNIANVATKEIVENFLNPTAGQAVVFHDANTKTNLTVSGSATAWDAIADPSASATVAFGTTEQTISSALNGGAILTLTNTTADHTSDTIGLRIAFNDLADANSIFARFTDDADGTPAHNYIFGVSGMTVTPPATFGAVTISGAADVGVVVGTIDAGSATSFELPNGAAPTVDAFGEVAGDNNLWGAGRGAILAYDGTAATALIAALVSDIPSAGQVPKFNADGTITWEPDNNSGSATAFNDIGDASGDGVVALGTTQHSWTSALNGGVMLSISNSVADLTSDTSLLDITARDNADVNGILLRLRHNSGASTALEVGSAGFTFGVPGTFNGPLTFNAALDAASTSVTLAAVLGAIDAGGATSFELPNGNDPDLTVEGQLSYDNNGDVLRAFDGANQVAIGRKIEAIHCTVTLPNDLADSERDAFWIWSNESGMSFVVTGWKAWSDTDDTTLNIEEIDADGQNNATVDAVEIATNGTGLFSGSDTTITAATIENGHLLVLDFDDTDTPGQVKITIFGYYNADVN